MWLPVSSRHKHRKWHKNDINMQYPTLCTDEVKLNSVQKDRGTIWKRTGGINPYLSAWSTLGVSPVESCCITPPTERGVGTTRPGSYCQNTCEKGHEEPTLTVRQHKIQPGISTMTPHVCMLPCVLHRFHFKCFIVPLLSRNSSTLHLGWHQIRTPLLVFLCRQNPGKGWRICCWMTAEKCWNPWRGRVFFYSTVDFNVFYKARQMQTQCPAQYIWSTHRGH